MAESADMDTLVSEFFQLCVEKEQAKKLPPAERKQGKGTTVRKILKDGLGESSAIISGCEASILSKHQDKKTKKITDDVFVKCVLPDLAVMKTKSKSCSDPKAVEELAKMKKKLCDKLPQMREGPATKNAAVVDRLTDAKGYTGAHKQRFDTETGKGKGLAGREDKVDSSGYVGAYKGEGTYDCKKH